MPAQFGFVEGHHHEVPEADGNVLVAARAQVRLARLERMDERNLEIVLVVAQPRNAQSSSSTQTTTAAATIA